MDIATQNALNTPTGSTGTSANTEPTSSTSALTSDFETFLTMLTVQMENQDPLNPIESSDYAVQLATFSGVEQQLRTNELLEDMASGLGSGGLSQLAGWVGMEARVSGPASFNGAPLTLAPEIDTGADAAYLVVKSASGQVVSREEVPRDAQTVLWAGVGTNGDPLPSGSYTFEVESIRGGQVTSRTPVDHYAMVREARLAGDGVDIVLDGGGVVASDEVQALRSPVDTTI